MPLKGNLKDFNVTQLLNLISLARKTGTLVVDSPVESAWLSFREGKLAYARLGQQDNSLVSILYNSRKLSAAQYRVIKERSLNMSDKELGLLLVNAGYLTQQDVLLSLQSYFLNIVNRLYSWMEGWFRFETEILPPEDKITLRIGLENVIIDGTRRQKEIANLKDEIPSLDVALKFTNKQGTDVSGLNLSAEEWKVVSFINPKNSLRKIAQASKLNETEMRRITFGLVQSGMVEMVRLESGEPMRIVTPGVPNASKDEQISLINRIIQRIRSL